MPAQRNAFRLGLTLIVMFILALGVLWFLAPSGGGDTALQSGNVVCGNEFVQTELVKILKPLG